MAASRPRVGVSSCLLGANVRFDGGHKRDPFVAGELDRVFELVSVCPEVELGLGVPRETLRLERRGGATRLVAPTSGLDHTERMARFAAKRLAELAALDLDGYVLKSKSPSCGRAGVPVHERSGRARRNGRGLFAAALLDAFPELPVEDERRLADPRVRERFVARVRAYRNAKATREPSADRG